MKRVLYQPDLDLVSQIDWARLAAYIDGEGNIDIADQVHKAPFEGKGRYGYVRVTVTNTDPRLSEWLYKTFGGSVQMRSGTRLFKGKTQNWKDCFNWVLCNHRGAQMLQRCLPYFIIKREQAELAISFQRTVVRSGRRGTPQDVLEKRAVIKSQLRVLTSRGQSVATGS